MLGHSSGHKRGENLNVLIIGAGAIGSLLAFRLVAAGHKVTAVGRPAYVKAVQQRGLLVESGGQATRAGHLEAVENADMLDGSQFDLVVITTKAFDTAVASVQAQPFVQLGAAALVMQNGVGGIEIAQGILGEHHLYAGVITIPVEVLKPAVIRPLSGRGGVGIASVVPEQDATWLVELFAQAGFETRSWADWRAMKWSKLMLNLLANAVPAILDWPIERVYANRALYDLERDVLCEARAVTLRLGVKLVSLPGYPVPLLVWMLCMLPSAVTHAIFRRAIASSRAGKRPSLHIDLSRGRDKSEIAFLNGAVVRAGEKLGVPTPINQVLCDTLLGIARGKVKWSAYRGQADQLIRQARGGNVLEERT
jgi:2-dehydropantoate 2-reductase